ncbi:SH3 domain-containing kinase-binding protein 1-like isoform X2 [Antedon mediterranea]|uniref:SH3 domain-containing kinase-binding protein 1-like isoform X2 n=1 Tax=Antedon mediterranea TaxID=105859 RepID=UPI003AF4391D
MENHTGIEAEVEFTYDAVNSDELELKVGDIIRNVVMMDGGWWQGEINGKRGMFPDNFVKVLEKKKDEPRTAEGLSTKSKAPGPPVNGEVHHAKDAAAATTSSNTAGVNLRENKPSRENRARVTYSYVPMNEDELKLLPNDVITDVVVVEEGWCEGYLNGRRGMFPSNFVSIIKEEEEPLDLGSNKNDSNAENKGINKIDPTGGSSTASNPPSTPASVQSTKPVKLPGAIGFGVDIFKDAKPLRKRDPGKTAEVKNGAPNLELMKKRNSLKKSTVIPDNHAVPLKPEKIVEDPPKPAPAKSEPIKEKAKVVYDYQPENEDELALKEGDIVTILDKDSEDNGWWYGECHGKKGVFPDNFVVSLPPEPERPRKESAPLRPPAPNKPHNRPPSIEVKSSIHKPLPPVKSPLDSSVPPMSPLKPPMKPEEVSKPGASPARPLKVVARKPPPIKNKPAAAKPVPAHPTKESEKKLVGLSHSSELPFDDIKSNNKLIHPNLSRPKTPSKRPPSVYGVKNLEGNETKFQAKRSNTIARLSVVKDDDESSTAPPWQEEIRTKATNPFKRPVPVPPDRRKKAEVAVCPYKVISLCLHHIIITLCAQFETISPNMIKEYIQYYSVYMLKHYNINFQTV